MLRFFSKSTPNKTGKPLSRERLARLKEFARMMKLPVKNWELLDRALTHSSWIERASEHESTYERLEFLGDSVLNASVALILFKKNPNLTEGGLSALRSSVVDEKTLSEIAQPLGVLYYMNLGKGETLSDSRAREKVAADVVESLIGVLFLEKGFDTARQFVERLLLSEIENRLKSGTRDYKTQVQKWSISHYKEYPHYEVVKESGPDHNKIFEVRVTVHNLYSATGSGRTKKDAEQKAAEKVLTQLKSPPRRGKNRRRTL